MVRKKKHCVKNEVKELATTHVVRDVNIAGIEIENSTAAAGELCDERGIVGFSRTENIHDMDEEDISMWKAWFVKNNIPIPDLTTAKNVCELVQEHK